MFRVWIIDDEETFRDTLVLGLQLEREFELSSFDSCESALDALKRGRPHPLVMLLDISLPGISGIRALPRIKEECPGARIIMLTIHNETDLIEQCVKAGAYSYLQKTSGLTETVRAIRNAVSGQRHMDSSSLTILLDDLFPTSRSGDRIEITPREKEILSLLMQGLNRRDISYRIGISEGTVITHMRKMFTKLGVHKVSAAIRKALDERLV